MRHCAHPCRTGITRWSATTPAHLKRVCRDIAYTEMFPYSRVVAVQANGRYLEMRPQASAPHLMYEVEATGA